MNIALVIAVLAMTSILLALLLLPLLWRQRSGAARDAYSLAVYRDQLAEIDRDVERGLLTADQAEAARAEIGRRILALTLEYDRLATNPPAVIAAVAAILVLPIAAVTLYWQLGSPYSPDRPFTAASAPAVAGDTDHIDMNEAVARLAAHLQTHPEDLTGWRLLGRSALSLGRYEEAAKAYRHAADLSGQRADISADWGEAQVLAAGGTVTAGARAAFETALRDPESAAKARYYLALGKLQSGDVNGALKAWRDLAAAAPQDADWLPLVRQRIAEAEASLSRPVAADNPAVDAKSAAAMAPAQRQAMIDAMVERLAARLAAQPEDADGWARLGRSYMVLNKPRQAREAYAHAVKLKPDDAALQQALAAAQTAANSAEPMVNSTATVK